MPGYGVADIGDTLVPSEARLYPGSIEILLRRRRHRRQPEVGLKTSISHNGLRDHYQTGRHESSSCYKTTVSELYWETDAAVRYPQNTDFSRTVGTTATKVTGMTVPPVSNPRQTNSDCTIRQTRSLFYQLKLTTAAIFTWKDWSGSQDTWIGNVETILGKYEGKHGRSRSEVIFTMCIRSM